MAAGKRRRQHLSVLSSSFHQPLFCRSDCTSVCACPRRGSSLFQYGVKLGRRAPVTDRFHLVDVELGGGSTQELSGGSVCVCVCMSRSVGGHQLQFEIQLLHMPVRPPEHIFFGRIFFFSTTQFTAWDDSSLPLTDFLILDTGQMLPL